jgi:hypothetical protein
MTGSDSVCTIGAGGGFLGPCQLQHLTRHRWFAASSVSAGDVLTLVVE